MTNEEIVTKMEEIDQKRDKQYIAIMKWLGVIAKGVGIIIACSNSQYGYDTYKEVMDKL